jgi:hypothetical protein
MRKWTMRSPTSSGASTRGNPCPSTTYSPSGSVPASIWGGGEPWKERARGGGTHLNDDVAMRRPHGQGPPRVEEALRAVDGDVDVLGLLLVAFENVVLLHLTRKSEFPLQAGAGRGGVGGGGAHVDFDDEVTEDAWGDLVAEADAADFKKVEDAGGDVDGLGDGLFVWDVVDKRGSCEGHCFLLRLHDLFEIYFQRDLGGQRGRLWGGRAAEGVHTRTSLWLSIDALAF